MGFKAFGFHKPPLPSWMLNLTYINLILRISLDSPGRVMQVKYTFKLDRIFKFHKICTPLKVCYYGSTEKFKAIVLCHLAEKWKVRQIEHYRGPLVNWYYKWQSPMEKMVIPSLLPPEITRLHRAHFRIRALSDQLVPGTGQSRLSIWKQIKFHNCDRLN